MPDPMDPTNGMGAGYGSGSTDYQDYMKRAQQFRRSGGNSQAEWFRGVWGGPIAWGEQASGHSMDIEQGLKTGVGGRNWSDHMTEDVYNSMSQDDWKQFQNMTEAEQMDFIARRGKATDPNSPANQAAAKAKADAAARDKWTSDQQAKVQKFADEMGMGVDELLAKGDTGIGKVADTAVNSSQRGAYSRGLGSGGVSTLNTQRAMGDAMQNYAFQRQQAGNSARMGLMQQIENTRQYNQGIDLQLQQAQAGAQQQAYQQSMQQAGGMLGMVGAGVGAYFGGPTGAQAGYQIGSGVGQQQYQSNNPYHPYTYKNNYGTGGGLGGQ